MTSGSSLWSENHFLCSICLDVFTDPVSTPCGHNFCQRCITQNWDINVPYKCPMCKEHFTCRPQLGVNTFIKEMVVQFRHEAQQEAFRSSEQQAAKPGEVSCDICTQTKTKALKSCLACQLSYCQTHLQPHLIVPRLRNHQLMEPVENLEDRICQGHYKPLKLFCRTDQRCICSLCPDLDHKNHQIVPLGEECERQESELRETEGEVWERIQNMQAKIQEIKESMDVSKDAADREKAEGVRVFTAMKEFAERDLEGLIREIDDKQKTAEKQAQDFIKNLEREISELKMRSSKVKLLLQSEDRLHLVQSFLSLKAAQATKNWTEDRVHPPSLEGTVARALDQLERKFRVTAEKIKEAELRRVQQFAVDVTLDPDTAHPKLLLSDDGKQVKHRDKKKNLPDNPERFSCCVCVLGHQSFSSGRFYFEVQVKGKTGWDLGVVRESISRKGKITASPRNGFWTVVLRNQNEYKAFAGPSVCLNLQSPPQKVGVFVDYEEGLVSFYDVDTAVLIYSFTGCCFTTKLYPYFSPDLNDRGKNSAPLIICPVQALMTLHED